MPFIPVEMLEGVSNEKKQELVEKITDLFSGNLGAPRDRIFIFFEDLKKTHYAKNGSLVFFTEEPKNI